ncbi:2-polyprenyl-3-methyl-5-hydroxy-6-metoxy-1,4-benzoquinol methylase [Evansella vedderi]|uniref:2-polyprenyl-3-methyl-5-hydroxy-6-metoxy-1, 4-benzoquinol methylase n=1 Tax=Evansella vedderi TaxID=38282 RepID=A0ABU0A0T3_9BACI|nr:2-polyprenyl-3-methyl-5-hydroxy-6-metoxy-1,4-benzoquinol methylase [Evansella vedderi]
MEGLKILCLPSGGGQQGPILAAAGADVTVIDISKKQLEQDGKVAKRDGLTLKRY